MLSSREAGFGDVKDCRTQFDKVKLSKHRPEVPTSPGRYGETVESLLIIARPAYRMRRLCGGDISFTTALTFDCESIPKHRQKWLEVSSYPISRNSRQPLEITVLRHGD